MRFLLLHFVLHIFLVVFQRLQNPHRVLLRHLLVVLILLLLRLLRLLLLIFLTLLILLVFFLLVLILLLVLLLVLILLLILVLLLVLFVLVLILLILVLLLLHLVLRPSQIVFGFQIVRIVAQSVFVSLNGALQILRLQKAVAQIVVGGGAFLLLDIGF